MSCAHWGLAYAHRPRKGHPEGGLIGLGRSPLRTMRRRSRSIFGSGMGIADMSALVYGCFGSVYRVSRSATSTTLPR